MKLKKYQNKDWLYNNYIIKNRKVKDILNKNNGVLYAESSEL